MSIFAERLKSARSKLLLGQAGVARKANLSVSCISLYESGKRKPREGHLRALAFALNTSVAYLLGKTDDASRHETQEMIDANTLPPGKNSRPKTTLYRHYTDERKNLPKI